MNTTIEQNIAIRREVEALLELAGEQPERYWRTLVELATAKLPKVEDPPILFGPKAAMNDAQAAKFEREEMPFGKHQGELIADVPPRYLLWLTESEFTATMRRYLGSDRFQRRLDDAND